MAEDRLNRKFLVASFIVCGVFWPICYWIDRPLLFNILNTVAFSLAVGVFVTFVPAFWNRIAKLQGDWYSPHWYLLGSFCIWLAIMGRLGWAWATRFFNYPDWMRDSIMLAFLTYIAIIAAVAKLMAADMFSGDTQDGRRKGIIAAAFMVVTLVVLLLTGGIK